jgi:hypothetical protein
MVTGEQGRKHDRATLDQYVNKIVGDEPRLVRTRDISESGVFLYKLLEPEVPTSDFIGLEMKLPNSEEVIWAVGQIVRTEKRDETDGLAVRFVRISASDRQIIADYITSSAASNASGAASATCAA